jgi:hypothetical protein
MLRRLLIVFDGLVSLWVFGFLCVLPFLLYGYYSAPETWPVGLHPLMVLYYSMMVAIPYCLFRYILVGTPKFFANLPVKKVDSEED